MIFLLALALRVLAVEFLGAAPDKDALQYHTIAVNISTGHGIAVEPGFPTGVRPPAYPIFLAAIYAAFGADYHHALYAQALLNALLVLPLFWLGRAMSGSAVVGLLAAGLFAINTTFGIVSSLYAENLLIPLALGFVWTLYMMLQRPGGGMVWALAGGILAGLMGLTKPEMALLGLGVLILGLLRPRTRLHWRSLGIVAVISMLIVGAWQVRDHTINDREHADSFIYTLSYSYYPALDGSWWWPVTDMRELEKERMRAETYLSEHTQGQNTSALEDALVGHPGGFMKLVISRVIILWASPPVGSSVLNSVSPLLRWLALIAQYIFVAGGLGMLLYCVVKRPELLPILALCLYMTIVYGLLHAIRRYGYPFVPELCLFAAWWMGMLWQHWRPQRGKHDHN